MIGQASEEKQREIIRLMEEQNRLLRAVRQEAEIAKNNSKMYDSAWRSLPSEVKKRQEEADRKRVRLAREEKAAAALDTGISEETADKWRKFREENESLAKRKSNKRGLFGWFMGN